MPEEPRYFRVRNWARWQGYKKQGPPWIKLYASLLDDPDYRSLTTNQRLLLVEIFLLYARIGRPIPAVTSYLVGCLSLDSHSIGKGIPRLLSLNFIELCPKTVAPRARATETETEKKESVVVDSSSAAGARALATGGRARSPGKGREAAPPTGTQGSFRSIETVIDNVNRKARGR